MSRWLSVTSEFRVIDERRNIQWVSSSVSSHRQIIASVAQFQHPHRARFLIIFIIMRLDFESSCFSSINFDRSDPKSNKSGYRICKFEDRVGHYMLTCHSIPLLSDYHVTLHAVANPAGYIIAQLSRDTWPERTRKEQEQVPRADRIAHYRKVPWSGERSVLQQ